MHGVCTKLMNKLRQSPQDRDVAFLTVPLSHLSLKGGMGGVQEGGAFFLIASMLYHAKGVGRRNRNRNKSL